MAPPLSVISLDEVINLENLESYCADLLVANLAITMPGSNAHSVISVVSLSPSSLDMSDFITIGGETLLLLDI